MSQDKRQTPAAILERIALLDAETAALRRQNRALQRNLDLRARQADPLSWTARRPVPIRPHLRLIRGRDESA